MKITLQAIKIAIPIALIATIIFLSARIKSLVEANDTLKVNQKTLLENNNAIAAECRKYKVSDSLNAYKVSELRLTLNEYKKHRAKDLALIRKLKLEKTNLQSVIGVQASTIYELDAKLKDTIIIKDTTSVDVKVFEHSTEWLYVRGKIDIKLNTVDVSFQNYEHLTVVESVLYKRFLGFLWKTKKIKQRDVDVVSKNPNTIIKSVDFIRIEK